MDNLSGCIPIMFSRVPVPGYVKTRLGKRYSAEQCAAIQEALAIDLAARVSRGFDHFVLCYSDEWVHVPEGAALRDAFIKNVAEACASRCHVHVLEQRGSGLGARLVAAVQDIFDAGADACMLMGSDLPDVDDSDLRDVQLALESCDVVLGPAEDGGYWVAALKEPFPELFINHEFSTESVLDDALAVCTRFGKTTRLVRIAPDIDEPASLEAVKQGTVTAGPHVQEVLRLL